MTRNDTERFRQLRIVARAYVREVNAGTVCAHCGAQPIEWHNPEHVDQNRQDYRISRLANRGAPVATIRAEMDRCTPLCRRCHMAEDGRLAAFMVHAHAPKTKTVPPCRGCGRESKPLRRGLCGRCNSRQRYYAKTESGENRGAVMRREYAARAMAAS